ncbi:poly-gamma-glutamate hydrolase family protein [Nocardia sp. NBC_01009]|uniref:poly-gamma-glutamate hydrolase family protein n=1 Tax=Nocardia sp. NBC_01009 TaxID=2975996 RepID=UPI0038709287|nr:poly-gamma-glutamate hydrolase family protein [Nocardia sp. NBC_01009]
MQKVMVVLVAAVALLAGAGRASADDKYRNYAELAAAKREGIDYLRTAIGSTGVSTPVAHIAIHGGSIEAGTSELARYAAQKAECAGYTFEAIQPKDNDDLHITSTRFDEPIGVHVVEQSSYTVSWHGVSGSSPVTHVGGRDIVLMKKVRSVLERAGFTVADETPDNINGDSPQNIANRNRRGKGVQLELSTGQRRQFFRDGNLGLDWIQNSSNRTAAFYRYVDAVLSVLPAEMVPYEPAPAN